MSWWSPSRHADRRPALMQRGRIKRRFRECFEAQGFTEVECGALVASPGNEAHLHAFETELRTTAGERRKLYLHTSPEFACKKLLAAGETRIFDFARVFRNRERGALHAPEFTMLEWYRANEPYEIVIADALNVLRLATETTGIAMMSYKGRKCDARGHAERLSVAQAFSHYANIDLLATLSDQGDGNRDALAEEAARADFEIADNDTWSDIFSKILVARVEPNLGIGAATVLYEYPRCEAALARATQHDPRVAERFELYVCGVELANGFGELIDPAEQRRRFESEMDEKARVYGERYPIDEDFLSALAHMPPASGIALGFDRLVMLATAARTIDDVLWTPAPRDEMEYPMHSIIERLCHLPIDFHEGNRSPRDLVESSGLFNSPATLTREAVLEVLRGQPALIDKWQTWSDDKRTDGWGLQSTEKPYCVFNLSVFGRRPNPYTLIPEKIGVNASLEFSDRAEACAEFIVREIQAIASRMSKAPNGNRR